MNKWMDCVSGVHASGGRSAVAASVGSYSAFNGRSVGGLVMDRITEI